MTVNKIKDDGHRKYSIFNENYEKDNNEQINDDKNNIKDDSSMKTHEMYIKIWMI